MPIRFRCAYCKQLMGISKRKAGTVVRCPKCAGEIIVPVPEGMQGPDEPPESAASASPQAFEDHNFDQHFSSSSPATEGSTSPAATETSLPAPADPVPTPPAALPPPKKRVGLFLSLPMLFVSLAVIVLLLILMFVLGVLVSRLTTDSAVVGA